MHTSHSILLTVLERIRGYLDESVLDAKYDNSYLVRHIISPALAEIVGRINMTSDETIVFRYTLTVTPDEEYYQLPACIGQVHSFARLNEDGRIEEEWVPRSRHNIDGPGWTLEANLLHTRPQVIDSKTLDVWYTPSGEFMPHYSTTGGTLNADQDEFTLDATPTYGGYERRLQAYGGQILRLLSASPAPIEERVIGSHDVETGVVTVRVPFAYTAPGANIPYEIAPIGTQSFCEAIAARGALKLASYRDIKETHYRKIQAEYKAALKTVRDRLTNMQGRTGKYLEKETVDNPDSGLIRLV